MLQKSYDNLVYKWSKVPYLNIRTCIACHKVRFSSFVWYIYAVRILVWFKTPWGNGVCWYFILVYVNFPEESFHIRRIVVKYTVWPIERKCWKWLSAINNGRINWMSFARSELPGIIQWPIFVTFDIVLLYHSSYE